MNRQEKCKAERKDNSFSELRKMSQHNNPLPVRQKSLHMKFQKGLKYNRISPDLSQDNA